MAEQQHCYHPCPLILTPGVHDILPNDLPAFALRFLRYVLKTAGRGILVRCKSHCASPMLKPPSGVPSHLDKKPAWLPGQTSHVGFSLPLLLPSLPLLQPSCFWLTSHPWPWCLCSGCFLCLQSFLLNARSLLPHLHQAFTYSNAIFLGSPSLALEHKLKPSTPNLLFLALTSFSSINTYYHLISCISYLFILFIISVPPHYKL